MDKIDKFLGKLSKQETVKMYQMISLLLAGQEEGLNIVKLKGIENRYRLRVGNVRIIFKKELGKNVIVNIDFRGKVYKNL